MIDELQDLFSLDKVVKRVIVEARRVAGSTSSTEEHLDIAEKALVFAYLYCSDDIRPAVKATLQEFTERRLMRVGKIAANLRNE